MGMGGVDGKQTNKDETIDKVATVCAHAVRTPQKKKQEDEGRDAAPKRNKHRD